MSRPGSGRRADRIVAEPGALENEDHECDWCPEGNANEAVYRVPDPRYSVGSVSALCEYHLAVFEREHPTTWGKLAHHAEYGDVTDYVQEGALVERGDLPEELPDNGTIYERFGLDEVGCAYFIAEAENGYWLIETDEEFRVQEDTYVRHGALLDLLDHVSEHVGWRGLANEWVDRAYAEQDDGGEQA